MREREYKRKKISEKHEFMREREYMWEREYMRLYGREDIHEREYI